MTIRQSSRRHRQQLQLLQLLQLVQVLLPLQLALLLSVS